MLHLIEVLDERFVLFINQFAAKSAVFDAIMYDLADATILQGGLFMASFWWAWLRTDGPVMRRRQEIVIAIAAAIGATLDRAFTTDDGARLVPEARVSYSRELLDVTHEVTEQDAGSTTPTTVAGLNPGRNIVGLGGGIAVAATDRLALFADYDASLSPGFATIQTVSAGVRVTF